MMNVSVQGLPLAGRRGIDDFLGLILAVHYGAPKSDVCHVSSSVSTADTH